MMGVEVKSALKESIEGSHGSYWSVSPDKLKKDIKIRLSKISDNETNVIIEFGYGKYFILSILSGLFGLILGLALYQSARESLEYLYAFIANPFIILYTKPPWLFMQVVDTLDLDLTSVSDLDTLKDTLNAIEYFFLLLIFVSFLEFLYAYFSYSGALKFANHLLDQIKVEYSALLKSSASDVKAPTSKKDVSNPEPEEEA
jgi:hypothetical protein